MKHRKLSDLKRLFTTKMYDGYGWLESENTYDKKLVLVHGVTGGKEDMLPLAVEYEKRGYHVYCLDLPGHGSSPWPGKMTFSDLAKWLDGFIAHIGEPEVLVSNSFSSAVVYAYIQHGFLPSKTHVILGCPTPDISRLSSRLHKLSNMVPIDVSWYLYTTRLANGVRTSVLSKKLDMRSLRWLIESERRKRSALHAHAGMLLTSLIFSDNPYDGAEISEDIQRRMTVILGTKDNVVTRKTAGRLKELLPHATHIPAHGAGHIIHFEAVEDILSAH
ncbi:MAG TPA: alpha/beta hydrolase [Candidatus Saccharimonadales bacterium]